MAKTRAQKEKTLEALRTAMSRAKSVVFADYSGLRVVDVGAARREMEAQDVELVVAKKTLVQKLVNEAGVSDFSVKNFQGSVGVVFGWGDEVSAVKLVTAHKKKFEKLVVHGGLLEKNFIDAAGVKALSAIPSKTELLAKLVGTIQAPVSGFVRTLSGVESGFVRVLDAIAQKKQ